ncbi:hypothetical protein [Piscibacillus salipiscarius]|uniref:SurA N-terminal domain-containing protein n=1 Tax=Piscibacillus salipiscarius TaxID=299480 RepID=A0ABW5QB62_9BACI|nr:hypothetical protein [Piscibacillus salipiscarius]
MKKILLLVCLSILAACSNSSNYNQDDVAAIVRGEEITVGDIRFFKQVNDKELPEAVMAHVRNKLIVLEAKEMGITVSGEELNKAQEAFPYPKESVKSEQANEIRDFAESQADQFNMEPREYYQEFVRRSAKNSQYQQKFWKQKLGKPESEKEQIMTNEKGQKIMDELLEKYEDEIEIIIK